VKPFRDFSSPRRCPTLSFVLLLRGLPVLIELGLLIYCLIDCIQTPEIDIRNLNKGLWLLLIIFLPVIGGVAWLVAGRPQQPHRRVPWPSTATAGFPEYERPRGPDDDAQFLTEMKKVDEEQRQTLEQWEADLRRREQRLRQDGPEDPDPTG
jgi:hypothetical protein